MDPNHASFHQSAAPHIPVRPRLLANDFRHPHEFIALGAGIAAGVISVLVIGHFTSYGIASALIVASSLIYIVLAIVMKKGSAVEVSEHQFPHIWHMAQELADKLDMPAPRVYISESPNINAYAIGIQKTKNVTLTSALVEAVTDRELRAVLAHEFGHLKCEHVIYNLLNRGVNIQLINSIKFIFLKWIFFFYRRQCELSADRASLLGTNDLEACISMQIKLAIGPKLFNELNFPAYLNQINQFTSGQQGKFMEVLLDATHPAVAHRIVALIRYYRSPEYQRLAANYNAAGTTTLTEGDANTKALLERVSRRIETNRSASANAASRPAGNVTSNPRAQDATINCGICNTALPTDAKFCQRCGTSVASAATQPLTTDQQPSAAATEIFSQSTQETPATGETRTIRRITRRISTGHASSPSPGAANHPLK